MIKILRVITGIIVMALIMPAAPASAQIADPPIPLPPNCFYVAHPVLFEGGENFEYRYLICVPLSMDAWNGGLVLFAHGYETPIPGLPTDVAWDQLFTPQDQQFIPFLVTQQGFIFATTSYRKGGLAVVEGQEDILRLAQDAPQVVQEILGLPVPLPVAKNFLVGASEGGLVTTLLIERHPEVFAGGLAVCGPIGDFGKQIQYLGDFRVLFDAYFKNLLPPTPINIPQELFQGWLMGAYNDPIIGALMSNPKTLEFLKVAHAPYDLADPTGTIPKTVLGVLYYNVVGTMDAQAELGVQPYGNMKTKYYGSSNDRILNRSVFRTPTMGNVKKALATYIPSGKLKRPLVTMHTLGDPIVPFWQQTLYRVKVWEKHSQKYYTGIPIPRHGHCAFTAPEMLFGFGLMVYKVSAQLTTLNTASQILNSEQSLQEFSEMNRKYGDITQIK
jgi:pimeloyl-ACP methyl ester carboxylesterase